MHNLSGYCRRLPVLVVALLAVVLPLWAVDADEAVTPAATATQRKEFLARVGVEQWHQLGRRGQDVKVAILDPSFRGYKDHLGKSLPREVVVKSFRNDGNLESKDSQHGILCAEVVHTLAPDAPLLFANWEPDTPERFLDAVRWAKSQGARVISCSVIMPSWGDGEGGGKVHQELTAILGKGGEKGDILFCACAGNTARRHWTGPFQADSDGYHCWRPDQKNNLVTPTGVDRVSVELTWKAGPDYDLFILDGDGKEVARSLARSNSERSSATARFQPEPRQRYQVRVRLARGKAETFHCVVLSGILEQATARGSIPFPGDGPEVIAVGAVDLSGRRLAYSSCGPNSVVLKPDLVATVPFPILSRSKPFAGTSAAAPQAAAVAALWWSRQPEWSADKVRQALIRHAITKGRDEPGHSFETGHGLIQLPRE
jgi:Subtilase family